MLDGEIILVGASGDRLDFDTLQQRIHPAASRVRLLAEQTPAISSRSTCWRSATRTSPARPSPSGARHWNGARRHCAPDPPHRRDHRTRAPPSEWFHQFEGAGLDGIVAKPLDGPYQPDKRVMFKVKHERTADCVVAGYRVHKTGPDAIGSLLLGLYNDDGGLASVGVIGAFPMKRRKELFAELQPLVTDFEDHPWNWASRRKAIGRHAMPRAAGGAQARTCPSCRYGRSAWWKSDTTTWRVTRFRHTAQFVRWRPDRDPAPAPTNSSRNRSNTIWPRCWRPARPDPAAPAAASSARKSPARPGNTPGFRFNRRMRPGYFRPSCLVGTLKVSLAVRAEMAAMTQMTAVKMLIWTQPPGLDAAHGRHDRRGEACHQEAELGADRQAGEADLGAEHLGVEGRPDGVGGCVAEGEEPDCGQEHQRDAAGFEAEQEHRCQDRAGQGAVDEDRLAADPVGELAEERLGAEGDQVGADDQPQGGGPSTPATFLA